MPFFLEDGTYLRVSMALAKDYTGLVCHNDPALPYVGQTVTVRFEVNKTLPCNTLILIGCAVARIPVQSLPGELVDMVPPGERLRSGKIAEDHRLVYTAQQDTCVQTCYGGFEVSRDIHKGTSECSDG